MGNFRNIVDSNV